MCLLVSTYMIINQQSLQYIAQYDVVCMFVDVVVVVVVVDFSLLRFWCLFSFLFFLHIFVLFFTTKCYAAVLLWWLFISSTLVTLFHIESTIHTWTLNTLTYLSFIMIIMFYFIIFFFVENSLSASLWHIHTQFAKYFFLQHWFFFSCHSHRHKIRYLVVSLFLFTYRHFVASMFYCWKKLFNFDLHSYSNHVNRRRQSFFIAIHWSFALLHAICIADQLIVDVVVVVVIV